jgi:hypothetical protein
MPRGVHENGISATFFRPAKAHDPVVRAAPTIRRMHRDATADFQDTSHTTGRHVWVSHRRALTSARRFSGHVLIPAPGAMSSVNEHDCARRTIRSFPASMRIDGRGHCMGLASAPPRMNTSKALHGRQGLHDVSDDRFEGRLRNHDAALFHGA